MFQLTGLNEEDRYFMKACPAKPADYFEMFTEQDCLMALSTCPGGDLSIRVNTFLSLALLQCLPTIPSQMWDESSSAPPEGDPTLAVCRPLKVEIFKIDDAALLGQWKGPAKPAYEWVYVFLAGSSGCKETHDGVT